MPQSPSPFDIFGADPDRRAFFAPSDQLPPDVGLAEGMRVVEVRMGFLEALLTDPRVIRSLTSWVADFRAHYERVRRGDPVEHPVFEIIPSLRAWNVPEVWWMWLKAELIYVFHQMAAHDIIQPQQALLPMEAAVLAPLLTVQFATERGESTTDALTRWEALDAQVRAKLKAADTAAITKEKRAPGPDRAYLRTRGRWVYESRIRQPALNKSAIARTYHEAHHPGRFDDCDCRKQVREALKDAERLLGLTLPAFPPLPAAEKDTPGR